MTEALLRAKKKPHDWRSCWKKTICSTPFLARPRPGAPPTSCASDSPGPARTASRPLRYFIGGGGGFVLFISTNWFDDNVHAPEVPRSVHHILRHTEEALDKDPFIVAASAVLSFSRARERGWLVCRGAWVRNTRSRDSSNMFYLFFYETARGNVRCLWRSGNVRCLWRA